MVEIIHRMETVMHRARSPRSSIRGFTLIELMIAVSIIAVLAMVALPAYFDQVRKSRRSDAVALISQVAQAQERWRANNAQYTNDFGTSFLNVRSTAASGVTALNEPYYTISVNTTSATNYRIRAVATGQQASDKRCATMEMRVVGGNTTYVSAPQGTAMTDGITTDANRCWGR
jgi:type IV pilus assembly protein PilE